MPCGLSGEPPAGPGWYCSMFLNMQRGEYVRRCEEECSVTRRVIKSDAFYLYVHR